MKNNNLSENIKSFIKREKNLLLICVFLSVPLSIVACVTYYSLRQREYSFDNLLLWTPIAFIILFGILWLIIKYIFSQETISYYQTNIFYWIFKMLVVVFILWRMIPGFDFYLFHPPSYSYDIEIKPSQVDNDSICIRELHNLEGIVEDLGSVVILSKPNQSIIRAHSHTSISNLVIRGGDTGITCEQGATNITINHNLIKKNQYGIQLQQFMKSHMILIKNSVCQIIT